MHTGGLTGQDVGKQPLMQQDCRPCSEPLLRSGATSDSL